MINDRHTAVIKCCCGKYVISPGGGRFEECECGKSYVDQERFEGLYVRIGGDAKLIEQICPPSCHEDNSLLGSYFDHTENKKIETKEELEKYLEKYNYKEELTKNF